MPGANSPNTSPPQRTRLPGAHHGRPHSPPKDLQPTFDFFDYLADELSLTALQSGIGSSDILREDRAARFPALRRPTEATAPIQQRSVPTLWSNRLPPRSRKHRDE
ncbi:hypothetical protein [Streptomyces syringium]|uniref:hypothetical protein n=1 Tax=Streptomyces syringium TaxID=76729 RepID=UPI0037D51397